MATSQDVFSATKIASSGNWNTAGTWSPPGVPTSGDDVVIPNGVTVTVNCNCGTYTTMRIFVYGTLHFNNGKKIDLDGDGELHISSTGRLTGGKGGSTSRIAGGDIWRGNQADKTGPDFCTSSGCSGTPTFLPIELISFVAEMMEDRAHLEWETASETNNEYFEVERLIEDRWQAIGQIQGQGTSSELHFYEYDDYDVDPNEEAFYRFKQVDFDGNSETFDVVKAEALEMQGHKHQVLRTNERIEVIFEDDHNEFTEIVLIDACGKVLKKRGI